MTKYSQHPEVQIGQELREAVERVASGIERMIVVTSAEGEPLAGLVSLADLRQIEKIDTTDEVALADEDDRSSMRLRESS